MLEICTASAGSGKTHKLTGEYLKLLFGLRGHYRGEVSPHKHILAVTFTNKATDEMKRRIISELNILASDPGSSSFYNDVERILPEEELTGREREETIKSVASRVMIEILHDYGYFNISTIDRFFQQTMRAFAREIGQYASYNVELDTDSVISSAIDEMISSLDMEENNDLLEWLTELSIESVEQGRGWNINGKIENMAKELFSESYRIKSKGLKDILNDRGAVSKYKERMNEIKTGFEREVKRAATQAIELIRGKGLRFDDFKMGSKSQIKNLKELQEGVVKPLKKSLIEMAYDADACYTKPKKADMASSRMNDIIDVWHNGLGDALREIVTLFENGYKEYKTASVILENLGAVGILYDINHYISEYAKSHNVILLSDTTETLNRIIDGSDTPFIYEKIGTRISNYMLDEFQDTSLMQWSNFYPLVSDSLASGNDNLIVGDVKQSIYRWRGSDWTLLNNTIYNEFNPSGYIKSNLDSNWRSAPEVVEFNNLFFEFASDVSAKIYANETGSLSGEEITEVYSNAVQRVPAAKRDRKGHVKIEFLESESEWKEEAMVRLPLVIEELIAHGYSYKDITLLVRTNREGAMLADFLLEKGYSVISDDSLFVGSSRSVKRVVSLLQAVVNRDDSINNFFTKGLVPEIEGVSLYEICEDIIRKYLSEEERKEVQYLQAFMDIVMDYVDREGSNIAMFLKWWEEVKDKKTISAPEGEEAIRIMTIHKSKGLGFDVVIMPFLKLELYSAQRNRDNIVWCQPEKEPFNELPIIPITLNSSMKETLFEREYREEVLYSYIDALNLAYVAFTRAKNELIIFAPRPKELKDGIKMSSVADILYQFTYGLFEEPKYEWGGWSEKHLKKDENWGVIKKNQYLSVSIGERLRLSMESVGFFDPENRRKKGIILHDIMAQIMYPEEVGIAVQRAIDKGVINSSEASALQEKISLLIASVADRNWFDRSYVHYNELTIIEKGGGISRPDRVLIHEESSTAIVIDYKSGLNHNPAYERQLRGYMMLLHEMGFTRVEGYLWYIEENTIMAIGS